MTLRVTNFEIVKHLKKVYPNNDYIQQLEYVFPVYNGDIEAKFDYDTLAAIHPSDNGVAHDAERTFTEAIVEWFQEAVGKDFQCNLDSVILGTNTKNQYYPEFTWRVFGRA